MQNVKELPCKFVHKDGNTFIVFENEESADAASEHIEYICFACFGGYMNALQIS